MGLFSCEVIKDVLMQIKEFVDLFMQGSYKTASFHYRIINSKHKISIYGELMCC